MIKFKTECNWLGENYTDTQYTWIFNSIAFCLVLQSKCQRGFDEKPSPRPRCVWVVARATWYCWSSEANNSCCFFKTSEADSGWSSTADGPAILFTCLNIDISSRNSGVYHNKKIELVLVSDLHAIPDGYKQFDLPPSDGSCLMPIRRLNLAVIFPSWSCVKAVASQSFAVDVAGGSFFSCKEEFIMKMISRKEITKKQMKRRIIYLIGPQQFPFLDLLCIFHRIDGRWIVKWRQRHTRYLLGLSYAILQHLLCCCLNGGRSRCNRLIHFIISWGVCTFDRHG